MYFNLKLLCLLSIFTLAYSHTLLFLSEIDSVLKQECREEWNLSVEEINQLVTESLGCTNAFGVIERGRCYDMCLAEKMGLILENGQADLTKVNQIFYWLHPEFISMVYNVCYEQFKDSQDSCPGYYVHRCMGANFGLYPKNKQVPIFNVTTEEVERCMTEWNVSEEEMCAFETDFEVDQFEVNEKARCYHVCLLKEKGLVRENGRLNVRKIVSRFGYIPKKEVLAAVRDCRVKSNQPCEATYLMYKCLKTTFGEYPVPV